jgi:hypothetical protein
VIDRLGIAPGIADEYMTHEIALGYSQYRVFRAKFKRQFSKIKTPGMYTMELRSGKTRLNAAQATSNHFRKMKRTRLINRLVPITGWLLWRRAPFKVSCDLLICYLLIYVIPEWGSVLFTHQFIDL